MNQISIMPVSSAASALNQFFISAIQNHGTLIENFTVSNDHPENITDGGIPTVNLYPFLVTESQYLKNVLPRKNADSMSNCSLLIQFLLSVTGSYPKLVPHILLDIAIATIKSYPILILDPMSAEDTVGIWSALCCPHRISVVLCAETVSKGFAG